MYVCNCNGIREREIRAAVAAGCRRPAEIFRACDSAPQCARCGCDMRKIVDEADETLGDDVDRECDVLAEGRRERAPRYRPWSIPGGRWLSPVHRSHIASGN